MALMERGLVFSPMTALLSAGTLGCSERCAGQRCAGSRGSSACRRGGGTGRDMGWCLVAWLALLGMPGQTGKPVMVYDAVCGRDMEVCNEHPEQRLEADFDNP